MTRNAGPKLPIEWWADRARYKRRRSLGRIAMMAAEMARGRLDSAFPSCYDWDDIRQEFLLSRVYLHMLRKLATLPKDRWLNAAEYRMLLDAVRSQVLGLWDKHRVRAAADQAGKVVRGA